MALEKPCKLWKGTLNHDGYGMRKLTVNGKRVNAKVHRETLIEHAGPPPRGKNDAMHLPGCTSRACYEPTHLAWGSRWENMQHAKAAGTIFRARGEKNGNSKLSKQQVARIMKRTKAGWRYTRKELADELKVREQTISKVRLGQRWGHL